MNRGQLLRTVAEKTGMARKEVETVYEHTLRTIQDAVRKGEKVALTGFGRFGQRVIKARSAGMQKNPFTGDMVKVAARKKSQAPRFTPAKQFKEYVGGTLKTLPPMPGTKPAGTAKKTAAKKKTAPKKKAAAKKGPAKRKR